MTGLVVVMLAVNFAILIVYLIAMRPDERISRGSVLPPGERKDDPNTWWFRASLRLRRVNPILVAFTVALTVCAVPLVLTLHQQGVAKDQRREAIGLLCDINGILVTFIEEPPDLPRDKAALEALRAERCDELLKEIGDRTERSH